VGAAAVLIRGDGGKLVPMLCAGSDEEHEVYEAEVYGLQSTLLIRESMVFVSH
jgi:hypothetical protein